MAPPLYKKHSKTIRRHDIDALRVIAFALLIPFHVGMFFSPWGFHIKNDIIYPDIEYPMLFLSQWRMPLLFVISGMGVYFAFQKRTGLQFAKERVKRLLIPLIFGCLFIVPPQIYFEYLDRGTFQGSYFFDFWPLKVLTTGLYRYNPDGAFSWHHLWFIVYLFIFSIVLIPAFVYLRKHPEAWIIRKIRRFAGNKIGIYIFIIPLALWDILLQRRFPVQNGLYGDWFALIFFCSFVFFGYLLIASNNEFWNNVIRNKYTYLLCGIVGFSMLLVNWYVLGRFPLKYEFSCFLKGFNLWSWILVLFGFSATYLNRPGKFLCYANEAVYPFYIVHQTIIIGLCYYLKDIPMGFWPKFSIMVAITFGGTWFIYEFFIRRFNAMRFLFGLKKK